MANQAHSNNRNGSSHHDAAVHRSAIAAAGSAKPTSTNSCNHVAATKQPPVVDAGKKYLKPEDFLKAYHAGAREFNEDVVEDERGVLFCKDIRLDGDGLGLGGYTAHCPRGVVLVLTERANGCTLWDAWIRKVPNQGHENALTELGAQLRQYTVAMSSKFDPGIIAGGGHEPIGDVNLQNGEILPERRVDPDKTIRFKIDGDTEPRVAIEVELSNRDPLSLAKHVHGLMIGWENLRCVIGLKIYKRKEHGKEFACVCFVWKKDSPNNLYVERVFDIGPKASNMRSKESVAEFWTEEGVDFSEVSDGKTFNVEALDIEYPLPDDCPDDLEDYFTVTIPKADVYHGHDPIKRDKPRKKAKYSVDLEDDANLEIDLFSVLDSIDSVKTTRFM